MTLPSPLGSATSPDWVAAAVAQWPVMLADHANCEKKAASTAIALMFTYADDVALAARLSRLAREELRHFEMVDRLMRQLGVKPLRLSAGRYAAGLRKLLIAQRAAPQARPAAVRCADRGALLRALPAARRRRAAGADGGALRPAAGLRSAAFRAVPEGRARPMPRPRRGSTGARGSPSWSSSRPVSSTNPTRSSAFTRGRRRAPEVRAYPPASVAERQRHGLEPARIPAQHPAALVPGIEHDPPQRPPVDARVSCTAGRCVWPWMMQSTPVARARAATAPAGRRP